jgi:imidazolonepropionase-like amidohydrolase
MTPDPPDGLVWLHAGTLVDGGGGSPARDVHVVYDRAGIRWIGPPGQTPPRDLLRGAPRHPDIDATGFTLLPMLVESHAHLAFAGGDTNAESRAATRALDSRALIARALDRLPRLVRQGVGTVRDAGDRHGVGLALAAHVDRVSHHNAARDAAPCPHVESPGAAIHHDGRYGAFMGEAAERYASPEACVGARIAAGADRIKLIASGIIDFGRPTRRPGRQMSAQEVALYVAAAHARNRQVFAHASGEEGIEAVVEGGVDSVEHGFFIRDDQLARMRDRDIAWVPTFAPIRYQLDHADQCGWRGESVDYLRRILDGHASALRRAHAMGVRIVAGSDAGSFGVPHGTGLFDELTLMEEAGLPTLAVIHSATGAPATRFGFRRPVGRIVAGAPSRFILARHSPLATVTNLRRERQVVVDGDVFDPITEEAPAGA